MSKIFSISRNIASSKLFNNGITITILLAGVLVGIETYELMVAKYYELFEILNLVILIIFCFEVIVKIFQEGKQPWKYFTCRYHATLQNHHNGHIDRIKKRRIGSNPKAQCLRSL